MIGGDIDGIGATLPGVFTVAGKGAFGKAGAAVVGTLTFSIGDNVGVSNSGVVGILVLSLAGVGS